VTAQPTQGLLFSGARRYRPLLLPYLFRPIELLASGSERERLTRAMTPCDAGAVNYNAYKLTAGFNQDFEDGR
jgi:hypothetical protein